MVNRPHQQAAPLHPGRQRDAWWRRFAAGLATLALATGALFVTAGSSPSTRGAGQVAGQEAGGPAGVGTLRSAALAAIADPTAAAADGGPNPTLLPERHTLPWGWGAQVAWIGTPESQAVADPSADPSAASDAEGPAPTLKPGAKPPFTPPTSKEPEDLHGYGWPLYRGRMTNFFGPHYTGFLAVEGQRIHPGLDTTTFCGDQVRAAHAGVVVAVGRRFLSKVGFSGSLEKFYARVERNHTLGLQPIVVVVDDGNGYRSMYVHLAKALVKVGDRVTRRTVVGLEGDSGNASGCHVHYELVRMDGRWMHVAGQLVKEYGYPEWQRERVDPLRVLSLKQKRSGRFVPGLTRPRLPPSLRVPKKSPEPKESSDPTDPTSAATGSPAP